MKKKNVCLSCFPWCDYNKTEISWQICSLSWERGVSKWYPRNNKFVSHILKQADAEFSLKFFWSKRYFTMEIVATSKTWHLILSRTLCLEVSNLSSECLNKLMISKLIWSGSSKVASCISLDNLPSLASQRKNFKGRLSIASKVTS